ncbi:hypothetical protein [Arthrospira platensis]|uniref:hypothetical protein n=1 Tax=Limnospira TaxID=2596745 RepID=UPI0001C38FE9|nr:hypothetical protein [Arthrospira platensis]AMW27890.1 hypothetical protein AP285_07740 [Arthrospira platensis YZ]KDR54384.1 hypothetical protein APPUASWS_028070 [Arthrospira platensis str. Paraca]MBD2669389.1 hypothetical protein [Arthrospira platensis FACHB-439]MBD2711005.1 hypothetical protein [Arthrospira platensis FACHB-835]MDT9311435.1 hypothetical protein [Limnospira sp. Paracas R14]QQW30661.1 hypothetical protein AP9108_08315 [Arthrospira sp. PCC 9108]
MSQPFESFAIPEPQQEAKKAAETLRELHPELLEPRPQANNSQQTPKKIGLFLLGFIWANPKQFYGKKWVTNELVEHSQLTAGVISTASLVNAITNQPILFFALKEFGVLAFIFSPMLNLLLVRFTNENGTAVAGRKRGNQDWAKAGAAAMIAMSILQSLAAAIGSEALNNRPELSSLKALEIIETQTQNLADIPATTPAYESAREEYQKLRQEFQSTSRNHPNWDTLYVKLYGSWADRDRNWRTVPTENLPVEQRMLRLQQEAIAIKQQAQQDWANKLAKRHQIGDDVLFVAQQMPQLFDRHFDDNYQLISGTEIIRLAMLNLTYKVMRFDIAGLGISLGWMVLSVVSSTAACWMTLAHARREDVIMSRDDAVGEAIEAYLEYLISGADLPDNSPQK